MRKKGNVARKRRKKKRRSPADDAVVQLAIARAKAGKPLSAGEWAQWKRMGFNVSAMKEAIKARLGK